MIEADRAWAERFICEHFGSGRVVSRGVLHDPNLLPGLLADEDGTNAGILQYEVTDAQAEVVVLIAVRSRAGIGTALMEAVRREAEILRLRRIWLVTTNNNRTAQAFYEAVGMRQCAVHPNALEDSRKLKPEIPEYEDAGVPIRDEIEYEWLLEAPPET